MSNSFVYIYIDLYICIDIYKLTERPVILLNANPAYIHSYAVAAVSIDRFWGQINRWPCHWLTHLWQKQLQKGNDNGGNGIFHYRSLPKCRECNFQFSLLFPEFRNRPSHLFPEIQKAFPAQISSPEPGKWGVQVGKSGRILLHRWEERLEFFIQPATMLLFPAVKDVGEDTKCWRKGGDSRRNNRHQSGSSGGAAGRTLSPLWTLDTAVGY